MYVLTEEQVKKVNQYFRYLDYVSDDAENEITKAKAELYDFLVRERTLHKKRLANGMETFLYNSGIYYDIKTKRNRQERNRRYYDNKKNL